MVQAGVAGQIRHFIEVDIQGNRTLKWTEVLQEALPEITEVGTKVEQTTSRTDNSTVAEPAKVEEVGKQLPNTGTEADAGIVALGLLGVMSGYGLLSSKKKED
ncbi:Cell wall-associated murein hydrolase LytC [Streptococcus oralis]|uniref:Cell wall-associated murein hydrolase LytC n=1 Tax=Streptococcus oralis TaxID=1303 RepID=A0A139QRB5_STROR|nr:Cell wall-associated murein hydrolase LytC [Streptococcus oralis]